MKTRVCNRIYLSYLVVRRITRAQWSNGRFSVLFFLLPRAISLFLAFVSRILNEEKNRKEIVYKTKRVDTYISHRRALWRKALERGRLPDSEKKEPTNTTTRSGPSSGQARISWNSPRFVFTMLATRRVPLQRLVFYVATIQSNNYSNAGRKNRPVSVTCFSTSVIISSKTEKSVRSIDDIVSAGTRTFGARG